MSADTIIKRILEDSQAECAAVESDAKARAQQIIDKAKEEAQLRVAEIDRRAATEAQDIERRRMQIADLDGRKHALAARRELIDEAFALALEKMKALKGDKWEALMVKRIVAGAETGNEKLMVRADEKGMFELILPRVNEALKAGGKAGNIAIAAETADFAGGFTLLGENLELNSSYEVMLREVREGAEREIAQMLFDLEV